MDVSNYRFRYVGHGFTGCISDQAANSHCAFGSCGLVSLLFSEYFLIIYAVIWRERSRPPSNTYCRHLFRDIRFVLLFAMGAIATFPLLVPPFFLPLFTASLGMSSSTGAGIVAAFNFSSALGRLLCGVCSDFVGPLNTLFISLLLSALSMLIIWPISTSLAPLVVFTIVNGMANGGFFSTIPTVVGNTFGSARVSVVMAMVVTGWAGGYLLVSRPIVVVHVTFYIGSLHC